MPAPIITGNQTFTVAANAVGIPFGFLDATDPDSDALRYRLLASNSSDITSSDFNINLLTGELMLVFQHNITEQTRMTLTVEVSEAPVTTTTLFSTQPPILVGSYTYQIINDDFNQDGLLDLAVVNGFDDTVDVLIGNGIGGFSASSTIAVGDSPRGLTSGHLNADEFPDIAVSNNNADTVSILIGDGAGNFSVNSPLLVGNGPRELTAADFNQDGFTDLAVLLEYDDSMSLLIGNGTGLFALQPPILVGNTPRRITQGDFNRDGAIDLAVANHADDSVTILLGDNQAGFTVNAPITVGDGPWGIASADFNQDSLLDLVVPNWNTDTVSILIGDGVGGFTVLPEIFVNNGPRGLIVADYNNDGADDIAMADQYGPSVSVLIGNGQGNFTHITANAVANGPLDMTAGDFNGDGFTDLAAACYSSNSVNVLLNTPDALQRTVANITVTMIPFLNATDDNPPQNLPPMIVPNQLFRLDSDVQPIYLIGAVIANDPEGGPLHYALLPTLSEGIPSSMFDITSTTGELSLVTPLTMLSSKNVTLTVQVSDALDTPVSEIFISQSEFLSGSQPRGIVQGDFNHDGYLDMAVTNYALNKVRILMNDGSGAFEDASEYLVGSGPRRMALGDFDSDSHLDLAVTHWNDDTVAILIGLGDGLFSVDSTILVGVQPYDITQGDFNQDGTIDLAVANFAADFLTILFGDGLGGFTSSTITGIDSPRGITVGDFNQDTFLDLAAINHGDASVSTLLGTGNGSFALSSTVAVGTWPFGVTTADFNGDTLLDLAVTNEATSTVSILIGDGLGDFTVTYTIGVGSAPWGIVHGDFNRDGAIDLAMACYGADVSVLIGSGLGDFSDPITFMVGNGPRGIIAADLDGDGQLDLGVTNMGGSTVSVLLNNMTISQQTVENITVQIFVPAVTLSSTSSGAIVSTTVAKMTSTSTFDTPMQTMTTDAATTFLTASSTSTATSTATSTTTSTTSMTAVTSLGIATTLPTTVPALSTSATTVLETTGGTIDSTTSMTSGLTVGTSGGQDGGPNVVEITSDETNTLADTILPAVISAGASGLIGFSFFIAQKIIEKKLQSKLDDMLGIEGNSEAIEFQKIVLAPIVQKLAKKVKLNGCMQTTSTHRLNEYIEAVHILVGEFYKQGFTIKASRLTIMQRNLLTSIVAQQIKEVLLPKRACCSCQRVMRFFKPVVTPDAIIESASEIATAVVQNIPDEVKKAALIDEKLTIETEPGCQEVCRRLNDSDRSDIKWRVETPTIGHPTYSVRCTVLKVAYDQIKELVTEGLIRVKAKDQGEQTEIIINKINPDAFRQLYAQSAVMGTFATLDFGLDEDATGWTNNPLDMGGHSMSGAGVSVKNDIVIAVPDLASESDSDIDGEAAPDYGSITNR